MPIGIEKEARRRTVVFRPGRAQQHCTRSSGSCQFDLALKEQGWPGRRRKAQFGGKQAFHGRAPSEHRAGQALQHQKKCADEADAAMPRQ